MHHGFLAGSMMERLVLDPDDRYLDFYEISGSRGAALSGYSLSSSLESSIQSNSEASEIQSEQSSISPTMPVFIANLDDDNWFYSDDRGWNSEPLATGIFSDPLITLSQIETIGERDTTGTFGIDPEIQLTARALDSNDFDMTALQEVYSALIDNTVQVDGDGNTPYSVTQLQGSPDSLGLWEPIDVLSREPLVSAYIEPNSLEMEHVYSAEVFA
jgi:hypothetical protein